MTALFRVFSTAPLPPKHNLNSQGWALAEIVCFSTISVEKKDSGLLNTFKNRRQSAASSILLSEINYSQTLTLKLNSD